MRSRLPRPGSGRDRPAAADRRRRATPSLLGKALEVERLMVLAYERVLASGALSPGMQRAITPYLAQEREHLSQRSPRR